MSSIFNAFFKYLKNLLSGIHSIGSSCITALPYVLGWGEGRKEVTEQYPDPVSSRTADELPPKTRGILYNDIEHCTGCKDCTGVCPTNCINVENELGPDPSKNWVAVFNIDFAKCIFCGLCVEVCEPQSLLHTKQYEGAVYDVEDMVVRFGRGRVTDAQRDKWEAVRKQRESEEVSF